MKILKAFRFREEPSDEQARKFSHHQECWRFVWNKTLALQKERLEAGYGNSTGAAGSLHSH